MTLRFISARGTSLFSMLCHYFSLAPWASLMAFVWVQHYFPLPIIFEDLGMGDELQQRSVSSDQLQNRLKGKFLLSVNPHLADARKTLPPTQQHIPTSHQAVNKTWSSNPILSSSSVCPSMGGGATMDMRNLAGALPDYGMRQYQQPFQHQFASQGGPNQNMMYQYQQGSQYAGQTGSNFNPNVGQQYQSQYMQHQGQRSQAPGYSGYATSQAPSQSYPPHTQMPQEFQHGQPQHFLQIPSGQYAPAYTNRVNPGYQHTSDAIGYRQRTSQFDNADVSTTPASA